MLCINLSEYWTTLLKLDSSPGSAILDLPFIARRPRRVLPTSFTGDVTLKLAGTTGDEAGLTCASIFWTKESFPCRVYNTSTVTYRASAACA